MSPPTWRWWRGAILLAGTITKLPPDATGAVIVCASHGGRYPGYLASKAGARAVIFNDAGIGLDEAGIGSLDMLAALGVAAAAVSHLSCRIGDVEDMMAMGRLSRANAPAAALGLASSMPCAEAANLLEKARLFRPDVPAIGETRRVVDRPGAARRMVLADSAALVRPGDAGALIVTGSHGGLIGGDPALALQVKGHAAVFNDAGRPDGPGTSRLPALAARGIAAFTVAAASARIGDAGSSFHDGIVSAVNAVAAARGVCVGDRAETILSAGAL